MFAFRGDRAALRLPGAEVTEEDVPPTTLADLTVTIDAVIIGRSARSVSGSLCYRTDRFDPATAALVLDHWRTLPRAQTPPWPDEAAVAEVCHVLDTVPSIVAPYEVDALRGLLIGAHAHLALDFAVLFVAAVLGITAASSLLGRLAR